MNGRSNTKPFLLGLVVALGFGLVGYWLLVPTGPKLEVRVPIPENHPDPNAAASEENKNPGTFSAGSGTPSPLLGSWPQFRGPNRDGIVQDMPIANTWPEAGPPLVWSLEVGEGHAGAVIHNGCVYLVDYDEEKKEDVVRCLSFDNGEEIWRYTYYSKVKRNHGMSRTVPAVSDDYLVTMGPKCKVHCFNPATGEPIWKKDLVQEFGTVIPEWYAGQCPLMEEDRVILGTGGRCLLIAFDLATGNILWETPNELGWEMTHSSILPIEFNGKKQYVWCASGGVVGVDGESGDLLWSYPDWKIRIATIPSPVDLGAGKIFLSGGYDAGSLMLQLSKTDKGFVAEPTFKLESTIFGAIQQTPLFFKGFIYGTDQSGHLACLSPEGERLWVREEDDFGLGPFSIVDNKLSILDDNGKKPGELCLFEVSKEGAKKLTGAKVVEGHDAWAPMAFADGRVILRDATTMKCLDLTVSGEIQTAESNREN
jgi:outer membrane protein assembly factor BamB